MIRHLGIDKSEITLSHYTLNSRCKAGIFVLY